jgi:hypothetical protein
VLHVLGCVNNPNPTLNKINTFREFRANLFHTPSNPSDNARR